MEEGEQAPLGDRRAPGARFPVKVVLEPALLPASGGTSALSAVCLPPSFPGEHGPANILS